MYNSSSSFFSLSTQCVPFGYFFSYKYFDIATTRGRRLVARLIGYDISAHKSSAIKHFTINIFTLKNSMICYFCCYFEHVVCAVKCWATIFPMAIELWKHCIDCIFHDAIIVTDIGGQSRLWPILLSVSWGTRISLEKFIFRKIQNISFQLNSFLSNIWFMISLQNNLKFLCVNYAHIQYI